MSTEKALDHILDHKFTQLRELLYVVTLVGICGDHIM